MADMIKFYKGLEASLPASGVNGALYITTDEGAIYLGTGTGMKRLGDFVQVANVAALPAKAHESCLYYCVAENILAKWNGTEWKQVNKQPTVEELKTLLGLGDLAYKSEVAESDLNEALAEKINASTAANHSHTNKEVLDGITADKVTAWDSAEKNAKDYADGLDKAMDERVKVVEGTSHTHDNKALLDTYTQTEADLADAVAKKHSHTFVESELNKIADGDVAKWNAAEKNAKDYADTELAKKVDKVEGKSLVSDTEITKLAGVSEGANKVEKSETNGNIKIDGVETVVYTHPEKHAIADVDGLGDALAGFQVKGDYAVEDHKHVKADITDFAHTHTASEITDLDATIKAYDYATKTEAQAMADGKDEAIAAAKKAGDDAQDTIDAYIESNDKALADEVKAREDGDKAINDKIGEVAEGSTVVGMINKVAGDLSTHATEAGNTYETKTDASAKLAEAKKYTDDKIAEIPAQTDYTVTITENTEDTSVAKTYVFTQCGTEIGSIKLGKELVVTSGTVKEVETADVPYAGAKVGEKYIELVIANQDTPIYVPAKDLVDIYTAKDGAAEVQVAISNLNEISATLVNGGVTEEKLAEGVKTKLNKVWEEVGVAQGLVDGLANGQVKANKEAIEAINNSENGILAQAKADATSKANTAEANAKSHADTEIAKDRARLDTLEGKVDVEKVSTAISAAVEVETNRATGVEEGLAGRIKDLEDNKAGYATTGEVATAKGEAIAAAETKAGELDEALKTELQAEIEAAKTDSNNKDAVVLAEAQAYADQAEADAIASAATDATNKVNALAETVYTKEEVEAMIEAAHTWGSF